MLEKQGIILVNVAYAKFLPTECQEVACFLSTFHLHICHMKNFGKYQQYFRKYQQPQNG